MTNTDPTGRYFAHALAGRRDITDTYQKLGDIPELVGISTQAEDQLAASIRELIKTETEGIKTIPTAATSSASIAEHLYKNNLIAAVDGTDAVSSLRFASDTIYAAGVILVTPQTHHRPRAHVARTHAVHLTPEQNISATSMQAITAWEAYLRGARQEEHSWTNTFREYEERELAHEWLQENENHIVLIDGPILTQNMLTQDTARELLNQIVAQKRAIGYIKDLTANPLLSAIGIALNPNEVFVMNQWTNILSERFDQRQQIISQWITDNAGGVVRAVYKVKHKAFGIECLAEQLPLALAILQYDNNGSMDHDIPMLLQIADKHVRAMFNGTSARDQVIARFSTSEPDRFLTLTNERSLR